MYGILFIVLGNLAGNAIAFRIGIVITSHFPYTHLLTMSISHILLTLKDTGFHI